MVSENIEHNIFLIPPGETLIETLEAIGMSQAELADRMGRPKKTINEIIKGKAEITAETALQLEKVLNIAASFWTNLESHYREELARHEEYKKLNQYKSWLENFPLKKLAKLEILPHAKADKENYFNILKFFGVAGIEEWKKIWGSPVVEFKKANVASSNLYDIACWLRIGELQARKIDCQPYDKKKFIENLNSIRGLTREAHFETQLKTLCEDAGIAVVFVPEISQTRVFGATRWLTSHKALIQMSLRLKSDDHFWFTFFHEAAHIIIHGKKELFIESGTHTEKEEEANQFARDFLIPPVELKTFLQDNEKPTLQQVESFAKSIGISPGIVVGRLQHDKIFPFNKGNHLKKKLEFK